MAAVKDRAARFRALMKDEAFIDLTTGLRKAQVDRFCDASATMDEIKEAHDIVVALEKIDEYILSAFSDEKVYDKRHN